MTRSITITIYGLPAAQGSKRHVGNGVMVESSKAVKPWRQDVVAAARAAMDADPDFATFRGPVRVRALFFFARPKNHYGTGANAHLVKGHAPAYVGKKPDIDKVLRSTFDALTTAGIWADDSLACRVHASKTFANSPGASLVIEELLP